MKCTKCGKLHNENHPHFLKAKGYPTSSKKYPEAHREATEAEKKKFPSKDFKALEKLDREAGAMHELIGTNTKSGKVKVASEVPKKLKKEVKFHEEFESKKLREKKK